MTDLRPTDSFVPEPDETAEPTAPRTTRGNVILGARLFTGLIGVAAALAVLAAAIWLPLPGHTMSVPSRVVTPVPAAQQRVCAGPLLRLGTASGDSASTSSSSGNPVVRSGSTAGMVDATPLTSTDNSSGTVPQLLTLGATSSGSIFAGSQSQLTEASESPSGDTAGFAASECGSGSGDSWLVGGATATGRTTIITLSNPTGVSATAVLTIYSETGQVAAAGMEGIVVAAGAERIISLAAFAPGATSPVVRVQSRGGSIVANLQQTTVRTLEPGGVEIVDSTARPALTTVIPGLVIANSDAVFAQQGAVGYADLVSVVRLLAPGKGATHVQISVIPEGSTAKAGPAAVVTLKSGVVTDVPLGSFADGSYTVIVSSDKPVVGGARASTVGSTGQSDFAWSAGARPLTGTALVVVAPGPSPMAHLANASPVPVVVTMTPTSTGTGAAAVPAEITIPAGGAVAVAVAEGTTYRLVSTGDFEASISYLGDGLLAGFTVSPPAATSQPIRIYR